MRLEDFLPKYPNIFKDSDAAFNPYGDAEFRDVISSKKEFVDLKLPQVEDLPERPGEMFNHQKMIARFLSSNSPYNELLLYHEMGTGKTCTAIACIEQLREENNNIKGAYVFARGGGLLKNFVDELLFKCTDGKYIPENYQSLTQVQRAHRVKKMTGEFYTFETFERFAKHLKQMSDDQIRTKYSNNVIVIDEVHNIRLSTDKTPDELDIYDQFNRFLHLIDNRKILLMSGTPIKDQPAEIANVMNLILPRESQFDPDTFVKQYFDSDGTTMKQDMLTDFVGKISGRISYLKSMTSEVKKVFAGRRMGGLKHFKVWPIVMSPFQQRVYEEAYKRDREERSIAIHARQASLFVFPDGTYGTAGSKKYVITKNVLSIKNTAKTLYLLSPELADVIGGSVDNLRQYSCKYADLIENILPTGGKIFVYCEYVDGSGAILLGLILQQFGYSMATGNETHPGKRYSIVTNKTSTPREIKRSIDQFNSVANREGDIVSIIIGSRVIAEGYTLKGVSTEVILTPHWNYSETAQAIARGWRVGSHSATPEVKQLTIYQTVALPGLSRSIDLEMYELSEKKDMQIKAIEHAIKISAFDCYLNRDRNYVSGYDGMRECDYMGCNYTCLAKPLPTEDVVTFDAYYAKEDEAIVEFLRDILINDFSVTLAELEERFPNSTRIEILKTIEKHVESNTLFMDWRNIPRYLRMDKNLVFLSTDPSRDADYYTSYYVKTPIVGTDSTFSDISRTAIELDVGVKASQVFKYPKYVNVIIPAVPMEVQALLLKGCIEAEDKKLRVNEEARRAVLSYFKGSYVEDEKQWIVTLVSPPICLPKGGSEWGPCPPSEIPKTNQALLESPIGYYGMNNPRLNDTFCLKEIQGAMSDLRKVKVGKKCVDYDKRVLTDIIARRIGVNPPAREFAGATKEELLKMLDSLKTVVKPEDYKANVEELKRIIFWGRQSRPNICVDIRQWMEENNLMEENLNCGLQQKKRAG